MEIDEFLTRIALSGADPTIFVLYEKGENVTASGKKIYFENRTLKTYTRAEDSSVVGTIDYDDPFPKQIFAMEPEGLKAILAQSANLKIDDTYMVGDCGIVIDKKMPFAHSLYNIQNLFKSLQKNHSSSSKTLISLVVVSLLSILCSAISKYFPSISKPMKSL